MAIGIAAAPDSDTGQDKDNDDEHRTESKGTNCAAHTDRRKSPLHAYGRSFAHNKASAKGRLKVKRRSAVR